MKIAIVGAGQVGQTLGKRWAATGHAVLYGVRDPADPKSREAARATGHGARAVTVREAASASDTVVFAVPWDAAHEAVQSAGDLRGKIVIDATNPIALGAEIARGLEIGHTTSAAERIAEWAVGARVVKAFNTTGWPNMANPDYGGQAATMFVCGDEPSANDTVAALARELGFEAIDAGPLKIARLLEPLAMLWIHLAFLRGLGPGIAFRLMRR